MPINIPSGLYTGGRATFDTSPMTAQILKEQALERARKAAEEKAAKAAIQKNYERMQNAVNVAGVRNVDIDDVKDPATGNVIAPGLKTQSENLLKKWTAAGNIDPVELNNFKFLVEQSKGYLREGEKMHQGVVNGKLMPKKGDVNVIAIQGLSMFHPNFKPYTEADMPASIPDLDENKWNEGLFGKTEPNTQIGSRAMPGGSDIQVIYGYAKKEKKAFAETAMSLVGSNPSAVKTFTDKMNNPSFQQKALPLYQQYFGKGEVIDTPEKAAAASALIEAEARTKSEKARIYHPPRETSIKDGDDDDTYLEKYIENSSEALARSGSGKSVPIRSVSIGGKAYSGNLISAPAGVLSSYTIDKGMQSEKVPIGIFKTSDGSRIFPIYQKVDDGKKQFTKSGNLILDSNNPYAGQDRQAYKTILAKEVIPKKTYGREVTEEKSETKKILD